VLSARVLVQGVIHPRRAAKLASYRVSGRARGVPAGRPSQDKPRAKVTATAWLDLPVELRPELIGESSISRLVLHKLAAGGVDRLAGFFPQFIRTYAMRVGDVVPKLPEAGRKKNEKSPPPRACGFEMRAARLR